MRVPQKHRNLITRLRVHANMKKDCQCVRCQAADEITLLRIELWEAYEQIAILMLGGYKTAEENPPEAWAEISDDLPAMMRNSHPSTD